MTEMCRVRPMIVVWGLCGVVWCTAAAQAHTIRGTVRGGAAEEGAVVVGVTSRNLHRGTAVIAAQAAASPDGTFELQWQSGPESLWLFVARAAADSPPDVLLRAPRVMAIHEPVRAGREDVVLQVPSHALTQAIWTGRRATSGPQRAVGIGLIVGLLLLAAWRRRTTDESTPPSNDAIDHRVGLVWLVGALALLSLRVGTDPLDLLEYSYFHEGVRPASAAAVLTDEISAELAHGPITPLILRGAASISAEPWALRLPSVVFGALFVWCTWAVVGLRVGPRAAHLGAALALGAPVAFFYARDATPYALTGLLAALSIWIVVRASASSRSAVGWAAFSVVQVVGFFAHYGYAFFSAALGLTLLIVWWRRPRLLVPALVAFAVAAVLPVWRADALVGMLESSGARFALMSPVYPPSPGLGRFTTQLLTVLTGLPEWLPWALLVTVPLWVIGLRALAGKSSLLAWFAGLQTALLLCWLVFSHTMSVEYGGGRVFYAYRWTRPLLLGVLLPYAGLALLPRMRWAGAALALAGLAQAVITANVPLRPASIAAVDTVRTHAEPGDAWAVLPAAFYGDPLLYAFYDGAPPRFITEMETFDVPVGDETLRGPIAEMYQPFETAIDRLSHRAVWVFELAEGMFGTPKFDPGVVSRTRQALEAEGWNVTATHEYPFVSLRRYECELECEWLSRSTLTFRLADRLLSERYLVRPAGRPLAPLPDDRVTLVLPRMSRHLRLTAEVPLDSTRVRADGATCESRGGALECTLGAQNHRPRVALVFSGGVASGDVQVEVRR